MDDTTSEIYYAQLVEQESTRTLMTALREVIEQKGLFCRFIAIGRVIFFLTSKTGEPVDENRVTQVGRALLELQGLTQLTLDLSLSKVTPTDHCVKQYWF